MTDIPSTRQVDYLPAWLKDGLARWRLGDQFEFTAVLGSLRSRGLICGDVTAEQASERIVSAVIIAAGVAHAKSQIRIRELRQRDEVQRRAKLVADINELIGEFEHEADEIATAAEKGAIDGADAAEMGFGELQEILVMGRGFVASIAKWDEPTSRPLVADKKHHLANAYVRGMRALWTGLTSLSAPKDGGSELRALAVAVWRDFNMPTDAKAENLDAFMARRFREVV